MCRKYLVLPTMQESERRRHIRPRHSGAENYPLWDLKKENLEEGACTSSFRSNIRYRAPTPIWRHQMRVLRNAFLASAAIVFLSSSPAFAQKRDASLANWDGSRLTLDLTSLPSTATAGGQNECVTRCAEARDRCRTAACSIIGGSTENPQVCRNPSHDNGADHQHWLDALNRCFEQEKKCDASCNGR